jgi:dihydroorotase
MQNVISKLLNMGVTLEDLIMRATVAPARAIGRPELGNLDLGAVADIAVWRLREGRFGFTDCGKARMTGTQRLECVLTMRGGEVVFDPAGLTMPEWQKAPADYWVCRRPKGASEAWVPPV